MKFIKSHFKTIAIIAMLFIITGQAGNLSSLQKQLDTAKSEQPASEVVTKEVEKVVETEKTPQACKDLVALDDEIINKVGVYFSEVSASATSSANSGDIITFLEENISSMQRLNKYTDSITDRRLSLKASCLK
jgi:hypothetical protein